jgi:hypothetical protein
MDYLKLQTNMVGYPVELFYFVAVTGIILVLWRPFRAFLFAVFCLAGKNFSAAVLTRTPLIGEFLNLNDLLLWIALAAMIVEAIKLHEKIKLPKILVAIIAVLTVAALQSIAHYGLELFVFRSIWSAAIFPIMFLVSVNMVKTESQARFFYWALFLGSIMAAVQHVLFLDYVTSLGSSQSDEIRVIAYITSAGLYLLVVALFSNLEEKNILVSWVYYAGLILMAISVIMNQTRQLYIIFMLSVVAIFFLLRRAVDIKKSLIKFVIIAVSVIVVFNILFSSLDLTNIVGERLNSVIEKSYRDEAYLTRSISMETEIGLWLDSSIILGMGIAYPPELTEAYRQGDIQAVNKTGALAHVAITSYLARFGLIGALIYLLFLPLWTIRIASEFLYNKLLHYSALIALLAITVALMDIINFMGSMLQTAATSHIAALIYGALWGLYMQKRLNEKIQYLDSIAEEKYELA